MSKINTFWLFKHDSDNRQWISDLSVVITDFGLFYGYHQKQCLCNFFLYDDVA